MSWYDGIWDRRIRQSGYSDLGTLILPMLPQPVILTDRADGVTKWLLAWNNDQSPPDTNGRITLDSMTSFEAQIGQRVFKPFEGPTLLDDEGQYILFIRSGRIGIDFTPWPQGVMDIDNAPIYMRQVEVPGSQIVNQLLLTGNNPTNTTRLTMAVNEVQQNV